MTKIGNANVYSSLPGLQNQLASLQKQCADWESCATTPPSQKQQLVAGLQQQIHGVEGQIAEQTSMVNSAETAGTFPTAADGVNRPDPSPFARLGGILNVRI